MKSRTCLLLAPALTFWIGASVSTGQTPTEVLTDNEADLIIQRQMEAEDAAYERRKAALKSQEAEVEYEVDLGDRKVSLREMAPRQAPAPARVESATAPATSLSEAEFAAMLAARKPHHSISVSVTVYDREVTKLVWRQENEVYTAWSRVDFNYLQGIGSLETDEANYSFFTMVGNETSANEALRAEAMAAAGIEYEPRVHPTEATVFEEREDPFFIEPNRDAPEPEILSGFLAAMHEHYRENEQELINAYQRRIALQEARRRHREANPPEKRDVVINFWPIATNSEGQ